MPQLLTDGDWEAVRYVLEDVTDTFHRVPIQFRLAIEASYDVHGESELRKQSYVTFTCLALVSSVKSGTEIDENVYGNRAREGKKIQVAVKDYNLSFMAAFSSFLQSNPTTLISSFETSTGLVKCLLASGAELNIYAADRVRISTDNLAFTTPVNAYPAEIWKDKYILIIFEVLEDDYVKQ